MNRDAIVRQLVTGAALLFLSGCGEDDAAPVAPTPTPTFTAFDDPGPVLTGLYLCSLAWGDCDNDGDLDLAVAGFDGGGSMTKIYANDGAGVFTALVNPALPGVIECSLA